ncbi:hypothetical protein DSCA_60890 [Desulfosarcina alkanivorans]|uniref:SCP domain-containing protein n=1 Tax=Desulfosarcina alkanivorans TaxID=571177 RepID=A0A5K7YVT7_9BACT|nr:cadherin-like domain-containing protein [Desulfosarcina alkanivorans]BBO72159.1 hypothetical protein DSCA_60890 [Desulfosarcina alkanivorans]
MKRLALLTFVFLIGVTFIQASAFSGEVTLFGAKQYLRTTGEPNFYSDTFSGVPGQGRLLLKNGNYNGGKRVEDGVSSAWIHVNGVEIFGPSDFNKNVYILEATVTLSEQNVLEVELSSTPGSYLTIDITENIPAPIISFAADPGSVIAGQSAILTWTTDADSVSIDQSVGSVATSGSISVIPSQTTTYTLTATGLGGTTTTHATVTVLHPPSVSLEATPTIVLIGESSTLAWTATNADSVSIDQGIGPVDLTGSVSVTPLQTTTYTLTATGPGGTTTAIAIITVLQPPEVSIEANPGTVHTGEFSTLAWTATNSDSVFIDQGIGQVDPVGSITVSPSQTMTYTLTAVNPDGTTTDSATVIFENTAPAATDDTVLTEENIPVTTTNVLLNDSDVDGDNLIVSDYSQATTGTVVSHGDGTFTYTPNDGFSGADSFTYTVSDGQGGTDTAVVEIQVVPGILTIEITIPTSGQEFATASITVAGTVNRSSASVFVNGIAATVSGNEYTADNVPLVPGTNTISVLAEDGDDTQVASITVVLLATIDLEPIQIEVSSNIEDDGSAKVSGLAMVTVANNGSTAVSTPYQIVLFEDTNLNQRYEEDEDNRLGETTVSAGPGAGEAINTSIEFTGQLLFRDNRMHVFVDSADEISEDDEANNILATSSNGIDLSASFLTMDAASCPDEVVLTARIGNAGDSAVQSGVPVIFYDGDPENGGSPIGTVLTTQILDPGQYEDLTLQWPDPAAGITIIYAHADDNGTGVGILGEIDEINNLVSAEMAICTSLPATDGISGQVIDAQTGAILSGVSVYLHEDGNGIPGAVVEQTGSDSYGGFAFSQIDPGTYYVVASLQDYIEGQRRVVLLPDETLTHQDLVLSPVLNPGEFRIVLTWGENPADLEAHLTAPNPDGCREHCFYWNRTISGADLDVDDRESYGPETITISQMDPGTYRFYVHDFTNRNSVNSAALASSGATVTVYSGSGNDPLVFNAPAGAGNVWHVFNLDGTSGAITRIDKLSHQSQPGEIDFPRITSSPVTNATYGEAYRYQIEAEDPDLDTLTYSLIEGPEGMALDPFNGLIEWTPTAGQGTGFTVDVRVNDGRCGEDTQRFTGFLTYLPIVQFDVEPCSGVNPGGDITLTWQTERAETVVIDQGIGEVPAIGSMNIPSPDPPVVYTITATNGAGQVARTVPRKPSITKLSASCIGSLGEPGQIEWTSKCADSCFIDQGIGEVLPNGSVVVTPAQLPAEYTLTCSNAAGVTSGKLMVYPCVPSATLDAIVPCCWTAGEPVTLEWSTSQVDDCSISPDVGSVGLNGSMEVFPGEDQKIYTISCNMATDYVDIYPRELQLRASKTNVLPGESTTLYWNTECYDACSLDQGVGSVPTSGGMVVTPDQLPVTYTLTATCDQITDTKSVTLDYPFPIITFSSSPAFIKTGESATLTWSTELATSCSIEPDIGEVPLSGNIAVSPDQNTTYTLIAVGPGGIIERTAIVSYVKPTASIFADPGHLDVVGQSSTLTWVFSNADTCEIDQGIGEVQLGGSVVVSPQVNTTYTITATGPGGTAKNSVTVGYTRPTVEIHADREFLDEGEDATLAWTFSNADICSIDQGIGEVQSGGSLVVDPNQSTTYTIKATGPGGESTDRVTLTCLAPTAEIHADPETIIEGQAATLIWQADHAASYVIEPDIGPVAPTGSIAVTPTITKTYTITATGRGGETSAEAMVTVLNPPSIRLTEPDGNDDLAHDSYTIQWNDTDYDSNAVISLYYDINNSGADGTLIASGINEDPDGLDDRYIWNTTDVPAGSYYVYARIEDGVNDPVVAYSQGAVTIDHAVTDEIKLTASDGEAQDDFGKTVAIDGEYAVVGAPDSGDAGAAYIFRKEGATWVEQAKLTADDGASGDNFGSWVSISGDTVVVGAPSGNGDTGAAYVFAYDGTSWNQQARLVAGDGEEWDYFGDCVAVSGTTIIVGARGHGSSGAVYVFTGQGGTWVETATLTNSEGAASGSFGSSVSIDDDVLIAGDLQANNGIGAAYIFRQAGSEWIEEFQLIPAETNQWASFGTAVSISGNYAIVGSPGCAEAMAESAAYIFMYDGSAWVEQARIGSYSLDAGESLGESVSINGNLAAVGEPNMWDDAGAVYLFQRSGSQWISQNTPDSDEEDGGEEPVPGEGEELPPSEGEGEGDTATAAAILTPSDGAAQDYFGTSVAMDGSHVIVGSRLDDDKGYNSGSAYIFPIFSVGISAEPETIYLGGEGSVTTTLSWTSRGADSVAITPDIGAVDVSGSMTVAPQQTTTYTITGTKDGATVTDSVTVIVIDPSALPTVTISATPETIARGESATLTWSTTNVESVTLDNEIGTVPMSGSLQVSPVQTTTYKVTAVNGAGSATASVIVTVDNSPITLAIASPVNGAVVGNATVQVTGQVTPGATVTVNGVSALVSENAFHAEIYLDGEGRHTITAVAVDSYGEQAAVQVSVYFNYLPSVSLTTSNYLIQIGQTVTLSWSSENSDQCVLEPLMVAVPCEGSLEVSPEADTVYTINATGLGKTAQDSLLVIVGNSYGNPSVEEQVHLEDINRARANPLAEAERLQIDLNEGPPSETISENPVPPLTFNRLLSLAAALHTEDMVVNKYQAHEGLDGRQPRDRMIDAGYLGNAVGENLASNAQWVPIEDSNELSSVLHDDLFVDAGYDGRGHRINILNGLWKEVGIGFQPEPNKADYPYGGVVTCDFGAFTDGPNFLLGVVYDDADNSGDYTGGEGLDGVKISVDGQTTFTANAGGYGLPIDPGVYTVTARLSDGRTATKPVTMEDQNKKIDFTLADFETDPVPELSVSIESGTIYRGQTIQFSWASAHAQGVSIDQDIGAVPDSGAIEVSPVEDTVYTITAVNEHGSTSRTISITFTDADPPPIVQLTVNPGEIPVGDNATLSWTSTYADTLSIDQDIGAIEPGGTMTVYPLQTTMYTITATGSGGTTTASAVVTVNHPITLQITEPLDGAVISDTAVTVRGTIDHSEGLETGLMVNSLPAMIDGDQFTVNHVPLIQGENIITAAATDASGLTLSDSITVNAEMPEDYIRLTASPVSGTSPFETTLRIDSSFAVASVQMTYFGPDDVTYLDESMDEIRLQVTTEGVHTFAAEVTDLQGNTYTDDVSIEVVDAEKLDGLLRDKWAGMKAALLAGDFNNAETFFVSDRQNAYNLVFNDLSDKIGDIISATGALEALEVSDGHARYTISYPITVDGVTTTAGTYVIFVQDTDGLWKIRFF